MRHDKWGNLVCTHTNDGSTEKGNKSMTEIARLAKSFELVAEYRMMSYSGFTFKSLPRLIAGAVEYQFLPYYFSDVPSWRLGLRRLGGKRVLPDFAMIGPVKSASSDLVTHMLLHPNVLAPLAKEILSPDPESWRPYYPTVREMDAVRQLHGKAITGFLAPYMHWMRLAHNFKTTCPDAKIIITLRDPAKRAYSHWKWELFLGGRNIEKLAYFMNFSDYVRSSLENFPLPADTVCGLPMLHSGIYANAVAMWVKLFGQANVLVLDVNDYFRDRQETLGQICDFLQIPHAHILENEGRINENPLELPPPTEEASDSLARFYEPFNDQLFEIIKKRFDWGTAQPVSHRQVRRKGSGEV